MNFNKEPDIMISTNLTIYDDSFNYFNYLTLAYNDAT